MAHLSQPDAQHVQIVRAVHNDGPHTATTHHTAGGITSQQHLLAPGGAMLFLWGLVMSQLALSAWKRYKPQQYHFWSLIGCWVVPVILALYQGFWRFTLLWTLYTLGTGYVVRMAMATPLLASTPRKVYTFFSVCYKASYFTALGGYVLLMLQGMYAGIMDALGDLPLMLLFYGMYFGVLTRDGADQCAVRMSSTLGYCKKSDDTVSYANPNICALCGGELKPMDAMEGENSSSVETLVQLSCQHQFHEFCILGWTIVGKKDSCPHCNEKVNLNELATTSPWKKQGIAWGWLLDMLRYLLSWHPLIIFLLHLMLHEAGFEG